MEYEYARIEALQNKIETLNSKIAHLEALIEVSKEYNNHFKYYNYENE